MPAILYTYQTTPSFIADAATIKSLNIDVVMNYYADNDYSINGALALLDAYWNAGLKGLIRLGHYTQKVMNAADYTALLAYVTALKDHPALYGWYAYDEPTTAFSVPQLQTVYNSIKAVDPLHPITVVYPGYGPGFWPTGGSITAYPYEAGSHDIFGIDTYPVTASGAYANMTQFGYASTLAGFTSAITASYNSVSVADRGNLIFLVQSYVDGAGHALPSAATITEMAQAAKNVGWTTKGIAFWVWSWFNNNTVSCLKDNPGVWDTIRTIAAEYHQDFSPVIRTATATKHTLRSITGTELIPRKRVNGVWQ